MNTDTKIVTHELKTTWSIFFHKKNKVQKNRCLVFIWQFFKSANFTYVVVRPSRIFSSHIYCITILKFELLPEHWCWLVHSISIMESSKKVIVSPTLYPPLLLFCESNSLWKRGKKVMCRRSTYDQERLSMRFPKTHLFTKFRKMFRERV